MNLRKNDKLVGPRLEQLWHAAAVGQARGILGRLICLFVVFGGLWIAQGPNRAAAEAFPARGGEAALRVLAADAHGVELELDVAAFQAELSTGPDGRAYTRLSIPGWDTSGAAGQPALPVHSILLAAPPGARLDLRTEVLSEQTEQLVAPVYPAPALVAAEPAGDASQDVPPAPIGVREAFTIDESAYAAAGLAPAAPATLTDAGYARDLRIARLTVYPVQYRAATREVRHVQRMRLYVRFISAGSSSASALGEAGAASQPDTSQFGDLLRQMVVNPDWVEVWRGAVPPPAIGAASSGRLSADGPRYRITLREAGLYRLTYDLLAAAGLPLATLDPRQLGIYQGARELAIDITGEADGRFDPGDVLYFYAEAVESFYTDVNTLWLVIGTQPGRRMGARSVAPQGGPPAPSFPETRRFELDATYRSNMPMASDVDHWYWGQMYVLNQTKVATLTLPFTITSPLPVGAARLALELWGGSTDGRVNPDHHVRVYVNGSLAGDVTWNGAAPATPQVTFDQALLRDGPNTLTLYTPGDTGALDALGRTWESNWLNFFDLTFDSAFRMNGDVLSFTPTAGPGEYAITGWTSSDGLLYDVTDRATPVRLTGVAINGVPGDLTLRMADVAPANARYYAASANGLRFPLALVSAPLSDLRAPAAGADYLVIAHPDFLTGVQPLVQFRRSQGLRVRVINVQDIYDEFSDGLLDPHAIRDFIQYAYFNWPGPPPAYVLLVGDGTYDFLNHEGFNARTFIPPYLAAVDPIQGETAADNRFVTVVGDDLMPDLHLGRLPVNDQAELAAMVNKLIAYETSPAPGAWRTQAVFVTDNADQAGQFSVLSDAAVAYVPPEWNIRKIYLGSAEYPTNQAVRAQQATLEAFNAGPLLFNYVGHSAISNWAAEILFGTNVLPNITNSTFPIMLPMTCLEGSYQNPRFVSVGESIVRLAGRGAIASWSPTGLGVATGHDYLHRGFYDALFNWDVRLLGPATTAAKLYLFTNANSPGSAPRFQDLMDTYVLLGDPATRINVLDANLSLSATGPSGPLAQGDLVSYAVTYRNAGQALVKGVVLDAKLSAALTDVAWLASDAMLSLRSGSRLTWDLAELAPGAAGAITITGKVATAVPSGERALSAEMSIISRWHETTEDDNRAGPLTAELAAADLLLAQMSEPATPVAPGEWVTFTLGFVNLGIGSATGVRLDLPLPVALDDLHVQQTGPAAILRPGTTYAWDIVPLQAGEKGRLVVSGRIPHTITWEQVYWSVAAEISATWPDADLSNNVGEAGAISISVGDGFEPDNVRNQAQRVTLPLLRQPHSSDPLGDQDWLVFRAQAGVTYVLRTTNLGPGGDTMMFLWDEFGNLLAKNDDAAPDSRASQITWTPHVAGDLLMMVTSSGQAVGFDYAVNILVFPERVYLPLAVSQK